MPLLCAIYGYECTQVASLGSAELRPRYRDLAEARDQARDKTIYNLTAVLVGTDLSAELAFRLEAVLSFIEHLDVVVTDPVAFDGQDPFTPFQPTLPTHGRHDGGGATLLSDVFFQNSRVAFIRSCLSRLADERFCNATKFSDLLFKKVETFRQRRPILEISYFLLYSGLEAHARAVTCDLTNRNAAVPITKLLRDYGFEVQVECPTELTKAISTYTHLRNALFHTAELETVVNMNGKPVTLRVRDFYSNLLLLTSLVVFKAIAFDDGHINWNSWIDRQPFK